MKKTISLLLALVLCLSLCACGTDEQENTSSNTTETSVYQPAEISLNEVITAGNYEFSITKTEFVDRYNNGSFVEACEEGNVHFVVSTTFRNIGKKEVYVPNSFLTLEYGDGYTFSPEDTYHLSTSTGSFVSNCNELPVMSEAKPCNTIFEVPKAVQENNDEQLKLIVNISGIEYVYILRPNN